MKSAAKPMKRPNVFKLILIGILPLFLLACQGDEYQLRKSQQLFDKGEYELVIQEVKPLAEKGFEPSITNFLVGESYRLSNRLKFASPYYKKAIAAGNADKMLLYQLAFSSKVNGLYDDSKLYLQNFLASKPSKNLRLRAEIELEQLPQIPDLNKKRSSVDIENLNGNTSGAEFAPRVLDNELILSGSRKSAIYKNNGLPLLGVYKAPLVNPTTMGKVDLFSSTIFQENANEGTPAFSKDGRMMVFAKGNTGKNKDISPDVDLYITKKDGNNWSIPERINISDSLAWDGSPSFSSDGKTLYFSSNRRGGKGGLDLYRVNMDNSGRFGRAINMGSAINTPGDEMFPFVSDDGKLYFSSNGHAGLGGLDLFVATRNENEIEISHLGVPMNSISDDFGICLIDEKHGYFSSNREGGKGDDDIYYFNGKGQEDSWWTDEPKIEDKGVTEKLVNYHLKPQFVDLNGKAIAGVNYRIRKNGETTEKSSSSKTGEIPSFDIAENDEIEILSEKEDYLTKRALFSMEGRAIPPILLKKAITDTTFVFNIVMDRPEIGKEITELYQINPIYYDLDKSDIRADAAEELEKIVQFLNDNSYVKIELGSHTDSRATSAYNLKLSQRRAESAVKYITSKGIDPGRISAKGYGESQLINECADGVNCTEEMHQQNRRTEFIITDIKTD